MLHLLRPGEYTVGVTLNGVCSAMQAPLPPLRLLDVPEPELPVECDWLGQLRRKEIDGIVVRGLFQSSVAQAMSTRLHRLMDAETDDGPLLRLAGRNPRNAVNVLGHPALPTSHHPMGPSVEWYLDHCAEVQAFYAELFDSQYDFPTVIERLFARLSAGRPLDLLHGRDGRPFGRYSVRGFADRQGFLPHAEGMHVRGPVVEVMPSDVDLDNVFSMFAMVSAPDAGGELVVYKGAWQGLRGRSDQLPPDLHSYPHEVLTLQPGDFIVFGAGRLVHEVRPVVGERMRWTMGAFGAFSKRDDRAVYWA